MKTVILMEAGRVQLVLQPESKHDVEVVKILTRLPNAKRADLYQRQGGFTAFAPDGSSLGEDLMIIFDEPVPKTDTAGDFGKSADGGKKM